MKDLRAGVRLDTLLQDAVNTPGQRILPRRVSERELIARLQIDSCCLEKRPG